MANRPAGDLDGELTWPDEAEGIVLVADGGSSPGSRAVAGALNERGLGTLLLDLSVADDDLGPAADRLIDVIDRLGDLPVALFGAGRGAAAALMAAAARPDVVRAVVTRDARPDLAGPALVDVLAPTLFLAVEQDVDVNEEARAMMRAHNELLVVATEHHLVEEPDALKLTSDAAGQWFADWFASPPPEPIHGTEELRPPEEPPIGFR